MAQPRKPPRLYLRKGRDRTPMWVVRHGTVFTSTGLLEAERETAEECLKAYAEAYGWSDPDAPLPSPVISANTLGSIYFASCARADYPIKIGWTLDVVTRLRTIQCYQPYRVELLGLCIRQTVATERNFHIAFRDARLEGEWFSRTPALMALIERCKVKEAA